MLYFCCAIKNISVQYYQWQEKEHTKHNFCASLLYQKLMLELVIIDIAIDAKLSSALSR